MLAAHPCNEETSPSNCEWDGKDRRETTRPVSSMSLDELRAHIDVRVMRALQDHEDRMSQRFDRRFDEMIALVRSAFPNDDPTSHRKAHEDMINLVTARRQFIEAITRNLATWGLIGVLGFLALSVWTLVKAKLGTV